MGQGCALACRVQCNNKKTEERHYDCEELDMNTSIQRDDDDAWQLCDAIFLLRRYRVVQGEVCFVVANAAARQAPL